MLSQASIRRGRAVGRLVALLIDGLATVGLSSAVSAATGQLDARGDPVSWPRFVVVLGVLMLAYMVLGRAAIGMTPGRWVANKLADVLRPVIVRSPRFGALLLIVDRLPRIVAGSFIAFGLPPLLWTPMTNFDLSPWLIFMVMAVLFHVSMIPVSLIAKRDARVSAVVGLGVPWVGFAGYKAFTVNGYGLMPLRTLFMIIVLSIGAVTFATFLGRRWAPVEVVMGLRRTADS